MTIDEAEKIKTVVENKDYIVQLVNTIAKTLIEAFENLKIEDVNMFKLVYNKALDDFVKFASDMPTVEEEDGTIRPMWLEEMAEQLKAGGNIELSEYSKSKGNRTGKQKATIEAKPKTERQKRDIFSAPRR